MYVQVKSATAIDLKKAQQATLRTIAESPQQKPPIKTIMGGFWLLFVDRRRQGATAALL